MPMLKRVDWPLLLEVVLVFVLIGLGVLLYWGPAAEGTLNPRWWHAVVLTVVFFAILGLAAHRRRRRRRTTLHQTLRNGPSRHD
jgi:hypothetical protein